MINDAENVKINTDVIKNYFSSVIENKNAVSNLGALKQALSNITQRKIDVVIVNPTPSTPCNFMSVYPEMSTIDNIIEAILTEQKEAAIYKIWADNSAWTVEIDSRVFTNYGFTAEELTALILHEIGHVRFSLSIPSKIVKILKFQYAMIEHKYKVILKDNLFKKFLSIPILNACKLTRNTSSLKEELKADKYAVKCGYGNALNSAIDKIIIKAGEMVTTDKQMEELSTFSINCLINLYNRQNYLNRQALGRMIALTPSTICRNVLTSIVNSLSGTQNGFVTNESKDIQLSKRVESLIDEYYLSEAFFNKLKKLKRLDPADLDYIALEINNIKCNDDKMMIISYIYYKLDMIQYYINVLESKDKRYVVPHSMESLVAMKQRLLQYRDTVINMKLPEVTYGLSIQFPAGYEG